MTVALRSRLAVLRARAAASSLRSRDDCAATAARRHRIVGDHDDVDAACRGWVRALGDAGWLRYAFPRPGAARCRRSTRARCACARETLARHDGLADFAFAMQGLGSGAITLAGSDALRARVAAAGRARRRDRRVRAVRARRRVGRRGDERPPPAATATAGCSTAARRGSPTAASPTSTACSRAPARRRGRGHLGVHRRRPTRRGCRRASASTIDRAAPAGARCVSTTAACPATRCWARSAQGFKLAHVDAGHLPRVGGGGGAGFRAPRARRSGRTAPASRQMFGATLADLQLTQAALGDMATEHRRGGAAHLSRRPGCATSRACAPRARRRWPR